jgi:sodium-dependent dicarboxylate transporter 2/3/5
MIRDPARNPGLLKLDLYCRGLRIGESCYLAGDGGRPLVRTRAGLGSGLELVLPGGLWTNVPVVESFAAESPYVLEKRDGQYEIRSEPERRRIANVALAPQPNWYERRTSTGRIMRSVGTLQGTYLGVYPAKVCEYWLTGKADPSGRNRPERSNCRFCSVGLNLGVDDADGKSVKEVVEVVRAAWLESGITYVDFNTGHYTGHTFLDLLEPYITAVKEETGLLIGVQTPPHPDLSRYDRLRDLGVNRVSFCFEIFDRDRFVEVCPGKHEAYGLDTYLNAVEYCARLSRDRAKGPWVTNGELIAGLEPPESTIRAIDWLTARGAIPTVCVFRPLAGTDYAHLPPPRTEDLVPVFARLYEKCMEHGLPIGLAPNVHVSLVLLPEEGKWFVADPGRYRLGEWRLGVQRAAFGAAFRWSQRRRKAGARRALASSRA